MNEGAILLIEDDAKDAALTRRAFAKNNFRNAILHLRDGAEAIDYLLPVAGQAPALPALVLLDLHLPKVDGLEVLRRMRADERTRLLPVVILTSSREDGDRRDGYRLGANSYVCKPVDFSEFIEVMRQVGLYWLVLNEPPPVVVSRQRGEWDR